MVVDDTPENLRLVGDMLSKHGYRVRAFPCGEMALPAARLDPPDLFLLDIDMPGMNGYELCDALRQDDALRAVPVLFLSALRDIDAKLKAFAAGGVDYIDKPFRFEEVEARVKTHLWLHQLQQQLERHNERLAELVAEQVKEISDAQVATIEALARLADFRDDDTGQHVERVRTYSLVLADAIRLRSNGVVLDGAFVDTIYQASPLHDIGKVAIPDGLRGDTTVREDRGLGRRVRRPALETTLQGALDPGEDGDNHHRRRRESLRPGRGRGVPDGRRQLCSDPRTPGG